MNTYLVIITTVLVLSQIIRVIQNAINLKYTGTIAEKNDLVIRVYTKLENWLDRESEVEK